MSLSVCEHCTLRVSLHVLHVLFLFLKRCEDWDVKHWSFIFFSTFPHFFPKHDKKQTLKSLIGGVDLVLFSLAISLTLSFYLPLAMPPCVQCPFLSNLLCFFDTPSEYISVKGSKIPACRYSFLFPRCLCLPLLSWCVSQKEGESFVCLFGLFFSPFRFRNKHSQKMWGGLETPKEEKPVFYLFFNLLYLYQWERKSSCRIFSIARIVRQWERTRGAIWEREFSYWREPQKRPLGWLITKKYT